MGRAEGRKDEKDLKDDESELPYLGFLEGDIF